MGDGQESNYERREDKAGSSWGRHGPPSLYLQLPSNQTLRFRGNKAAAWGATWEGASEPKVDPQEFVPEFVGGEEEEDSKPLKELPLCLEEKRKLRVLQEQAASRLSGWELWHVWKRRTLRRVRSQASSVVAYGEMWRSTLRHIGGMGKFSGEGDRVGHVLCFMGSDLSSSLCAGQFGTGIQSYFNFLRFLVLMNFVASLLVAGFVIAPNAAFEALSLNRTSHQNSSLVNEACLTYNPSPRGLVSFFSYIMDLLSGKSFMELTYLFYGYYQNSAVNFVGFSYNCPLAYVLTALFYLHFSLTWIVRRSVYCLKRSLVSEDASLGSYSNKVFAGWDFGLVEHRAAQLKHNSIRYELRMDLEEEAVRRRQAEMTTAQRVRLYVLRGVLNILVLGLLGGSFYCIYRAATYSQSLLGGCWETSVGQEMYRLMIFDLLVMLLVMLFVAFPRKPFYPTLTSFTQALKI
ncbi:transmembrane channel-like protein 4 isoform X3 [Zootoca vivipara]|uniref:transmembrane channel-like protein 4 isoform X3 n=1 Tax=Zootoca vivipara TaxID=8524 RepID=UPI00293B9D84|nr:transmembrane channel-like protein 4 isoform X3 [Zootoca vivipara]